jgi:hypothetical protein
MDKTHCWDEAIFKSASRHIFLQKRHLRMLKGKVHPAYPGIEIPGV